MSRFSRQIRLADVGESGQAKLEAAHVVPRTHGFARTIEVAYLRAAGVPVSPEAGGHAAGSPGATPAESADLGLRNEAAREVAEGAYAALLAMRDALGVTS